MSSRKLEISVKDTKILCKDGLNKDRNGMDLTETEDIKKRRQQYTRTVQKRSSQQR